MVGLAVPDLSVPQVQQEPLAGRPTPRLPEGVGAEAFGSDVGSAAAKFGQAMQLHADRTAVTEAQTKIENATVDLTHDPQNGALTKQGKDSLNLAQQYLPKYDEATANIASTLANRRQLEAFQQAAAQRRVALTQTLDAHEFQQMKAYQDEVDKGGIQSAIQSASANYTSPDVLAQSRQDIEAIVHNNAERAGIHYNDPEGKKIIDTTIQKQISTMHEQVLTTMVAGGQIKDARAYLYGHMGEMSPQNSEVAQRMIYGAEEHAMVLEDKARQKHADAIMNRAIIMSTQGQLTPAWVVQNARSLKPHELQFLLNEASGKEASTDANTYADLLTRGTQGQDVRNDANAALQRHQLSLTDYTRLVELSGKDRPNYVKAGSEYISQALQVDLMNPDPAKATSRANALRDWDTWNQQNPKAEPESAARASQAIAQRYLLIDPAKSQLSLPVPRYLIGSRTAPDIDKTEARTIQALNSGEITREEAARQAILVRQWRQAVAARKKPAGNSP